LRVSGDAIVADESSSLIASAAGLKGKEPVIAGELFAPIKGDDDSTWSLSDGIVSLELQKVGKNWWPHVVLGAPKRDTTRMTPTTSKLSDLDGGFSSIRRPRRSKN
jgi:hypothetical protein